MSLNSLPPDVASLKSLTKHSALAALPSSQGAYSSLEAHLRLYLANNSFTQIPPVVLDLTNLRFLSLRQNDLTKIPPGIRQLVNLETLNVSGNKLKYLPFEVLELIQFQGLKQLIADPNPWITPSASAMQVAKPVLVQHRLHSTHSKRIAMDIPESLRPNGMVDWTAQERSKFTADANSSHCPGLAELVLRRISKLQSLSNLEEWVSDDIPDTVQTMLITARDAQISGGRLCTICGQSFILPRKQWIEWWTLNLIPSSGGQSHDRLPFFRQQCHPQCIGRSADQAPPP